MNNDLNDSADVETDIDGLPSEDDEKYVDKNM